MLLAWLTIAVAVITLTAGFRLLREEYRVERLIDAYEARLIAEGWLPEDWREHRWQPKPPTGFEFLQQECKRFNEASRDRINELRKLTDG